MGHGRTRLHVQKARWSSTWHASTLELRWTDGESFDVDEKPEITDDDIADQHPRRRRREPRHRLEQGREGNHPASNATRRRTIRDRLLTDRKLVNVVKENGLEVALDHCDKGVDQPTYTSPPTPPSRTFVPTRTKPGRSPSSATDGRADSYFVPSSLRK